MTCNVGGIDRGIRIAMGAALIAWPLFLDGPVWGWIGAIPLATGLIGWCPIYLPFGLKTCKAKKR